MIDFAEVRENVAEYRVIAAPRHGDARADGATAGRNQRGAGPSMADNVRLSVHGRLPSIAGRETDSFSDAAIRGSRDILKLRGPDSPQKPMTLS